MDMREATILIVPGLRDDVAEHWQTWLASRLQRVRTVPPMGRDDLDCARRVAAIEREATAIDGPLILVAHSGGVIMTAHWARLSKRRVQGALLATPPDFEQPMPAGYPTMEALQQGDWLPVPRNRLPFPSIVAASRDDPLGRIDRVTKLARDWGSRVVDLGAVGHLNPASGFGQWPQAEELVRELSAERAAAAAAVL
jgi:predicted alpha/beta hydrolase family esterase